MRAGSRLAQAHRARRFSQGSPKVPAQRAQGPGNHLAALWDDGDGSAPEEELRGAAERPFCLCDSAQCLFAAAIYWGEGKKEKTPKTNKLAERPV